MHDPQLVPVPGVGKEHHLRAGEMAYADNQFRAGHFLGYMPAFGGKKLRGCMEGETVGNVNEIGREHGYSCTAVSEVIVQMGYTCRLQMSPAPMCRCHG